MNKEPIVDSIVTKLQADFDVVSVDFAIAKKLPEAESGYELGLKRSIVYVVYTGSQANPSVSTRANVQPRKMKFSVEAHAKNLYGAGGISVIGDVVEQSLQGFQPVNCERMYLLRDEIGKHEGVWVHVFEWECETMLVQKDDSDSVIVPSFTQIISPEI